MNIKSRLPILAACFALAASIVFAMGYSGAATYQGDGALPNGAGGWAQPPGATGPDDPNYNWFCGAMCHAMSSAQFRKDMVCLDCHGSGINTDNMCLNRPSCTHNASGLGYTCESRPVDASFCDKSTYLMTGHKNVLRAVVPASPWAGPDGSLYGASDPYGSGSIFDWVSGTVNVGGTGTAAPLFYIFGGWMSPSTLNTIYDGGFTGELSSGGSYRCARCHATGYRFDASGPFPVQSDAGLSRIPDGGSSPTSSWYEDGIQCERCHRDAANDAGGHVCYDSNGNHLPAYDGNWQACRWSSLIYGGGNTMKAAVPTFEKATALCIECHRQESVDAAGNIVMSTELRVGDKGSCSDGTSPDYTSCLNSSAMWLYSPSFGEGSDGQEFLNSPHARFTGLLSQNAQNSPDLSVYVDGTYDSLFKNSETGPDFGKNKGCTGCHDVHKSTIAETGQTGAAQECTGCHSINLNNIQHPSGPGTPLADVPAKGAMSACVTCHMPGSLHLFRISVDASYSTFPTEDQFYFGDTSANTSPEGAFDAVWVDLDLACGQCHGGSGGAGAIHNNAPYMTKDALAGYAAGMHNGVSTQTPAPPAPGISNSSILGDASWTATLYDSSTPGSSPLSGIMMAWGDGVVTSGQPGSTFIHTYVKAGAYVVTQTATDTDGATASATYTVNVANPQINGHVFKSDGVTPIGGAYVWVTRSSNGKTNSYITGTTSTGAFSFANIGPGNYTQLKATKSGYTFPAPADTINTSGGDNVIRAD